MPGLDPRIYVLTYPTDPEKDVGGRVEPATATSRCMEFRSTADFPGETGPQVTTAAAPEVPDFAFEAGGVQQTLRQMLETGPVLLVLFVPPVPVERLQQLAAVQPRLGAAGLQVVAAVLATSPDEPSEGSHTPPFVVTVSSEASSALALFRAAEDGGETELLLDRGGKIRARWTSNMPGGLAPTDVLISDAERVGRIAVATPSHAGHSH